MTVITMNLTKHQQPSIPSITIDIHCFYIKKSIEFIEICRAEMEIKTY